MSQNKVTEYEISPEDVEFIRKAANEGADKSKLAKRYNCDVGHINFIANRNMASIKKVEESNAKKI